MKKRVIAINLPQFHPFKENDEWWGKGFTEWTNVTKAKPRFKGHYQPHLPTETGFYDLRLPEARDMQAELARESGIYGFCYYHYWFNGHQLMERPVNDILGSGSPNYPFMLCWANENWARNWDGDFKEILIEQKYSEEDDVMHMRWLCENVFCDKRYIRVHNKPVFVIYKPFLFTNIERTISIWRNVASEYNESLYLCFMLNGSEERSGVLAKGFDAAIEFQPNFDFGLPYSYQNKYRWLYYRIKRKLAHYFKIRFNDDPRITDYKLFAEGQFEIQKTNTLKQYPCVTPRWDNSPRRVNTNYYWALNNESPELYGKWLANVLSYFQPYSEEENFVFINAWNEWAEGNHLEPDVKWGREYIKETRRVIDLCNNDTR